MDEIRRVLKAQIKLHEGILLTSNQIIFLVHYLE